jgi:O-antigen ligase
MIYAMGLIGLGLAWLIPGHYFPWFSFEQEVAAAIGAGLVGIAALASTAGRPLRWTGPSLTAALLALVPPLQWLGGLITYRMHAILPALYLLAFAMAVVAAASVYAADRERFAAALFGTLLGAAIASTGLAFAQWLQVGRWEWLEPAGNRIYANLAQPNHLASLLGLGLAGALWFYETRRIGAVAATTAVAFLGFGLAMAQSRTGWLAATAVVAAIFATRRRLVFRTPPLAALGALVALAALVSAWQPLNAVLGLGVEGSTAQRVSSAGTRPGHWLNLIDAVSRAPWLGYGWGQVSVAQQVALLEHPAQHEWLAYSHNLLIDLMVYMGVLLGLTAFGALLWWFARRIRACKDMDTWAALVGVGLLFIHAMVEFPHAYLYFLLPLALLIGLVEHRFVAQPTARFGWQLPPATFAAALIAMAGMLAWIWIEHDELEEAARRLSLKEAGLINDEAPFVPDLVLLDGQRDFIRFRMLETVPGMSDPELDWMRGVTRHFPTQVVLLRHALAAGLNRRPSEALVSLQILCKLGSRSHCAEGRSRWAAAQLKFEVLREIQFPVDEAQ